MKKSVLIPVFLLLFGISSSLTAHTSAPDPSNLQKVREQIIEFIDHPDVSRFDFDQAESTLHFLINKNNEIVVLYVDTQSDFVDDYLKSRLNYKQLKNTRLRGRYAMKITLKNGSI
ncbi:MAG: hypothetical protein HKN87_06620 [Saprospiraceae bacterium]|nr:hypothetical protein [Saprospiraceae bacterium]